jgi:hypothetical protein
MVHDLRATSTAGRIEGDATAETILDAVKDAPEKEDRAQRKTDFKAERIESGSTLNHAKEKADQAQREERRLDKVSATEKPSPSVVETEETTAEQGTRIMQQVHCVDSAVVMSEPGMSATTDSTLSVPEKKKCRDSAMAEINKKWKKIKRKVLESKKKIKRMVRGSKKKIKSDKDVAENRRKIVPLQWTFNSRMIEPTFVKASMNDMAETVVEDYEKHLGRSIKRTKTPRFSGMTLQNGEDDEAAEGRIVMEKYRTLVGKSLHYVTKIAPDCANAAKELSQHMARPSQENWRAMERLNECIMKRIDVRMHLMKDEVTAGKVKIITEENESDILTRNVNDKRLLFLHLARDLLSGGTLRYWNREDNKVEGLSSDRRNGWSVTRQ